MCMSLNGPLQYLYAQKCVLFGNALQGNIWKRHLVIIYGRSDLEIKHILV